MQENRIILDTNSAAWETVENAGIALKSLNPRTARGGQTQLLRSKPRPASEIADRRPQYHPVDEEFLCLDGRFTLEGTHWLTPMSYVFYPAGLVHGFNVDVPDGYEVYIRNSGPLETDRIDAPVQDSLYFVDEYANDGREIVVSNCLELVRDAVQSSLISVIVLRKEEERGEGTFVIALPYNGKITAQISSREDHVELFVLEGEIRQDDQELIGKSGYMYLSAADDLNLTSSGPSVFLLTYSGEGLAREITHQAQNLLSVPNLHTSV